MAMLTKVVHELCSDEPAAANYHDFHVLNQTSFPKTRSKSSINLLRAWAARVSTPTRRVWMTTGTGPAALRGSFARAVSSRPTAVDCSGVGRSLRSKFSTPLAQVRSSRTGPRSPAEYPVHRREIRLGPSRGACVARCQQSRCGCQPSLLPPGCVAHAPWLCYLSRAWTYLYLFRAELCVRGSARHQWLNLTWIRAAIDGIVAIQFLLAASKHAEKTALEARRIRR